MRYELADYEWLAIKPMLPNKPRGVARVNDRRVLNGIFWVLPYITRAEGEVSFRFPTRPPAVKEKADARPGGSPLCHAAALATTFALVPYSVPGLFSSLSILCEAGQARQGYRRRCAHLLVASKLEGQPALSFGRLLIFGTAT